MTRRVHCECSNSPKRLRSGSGHASRAAVRAAPALALAFPTAATDVRLAILLEITPARERPRDRVGADPRVARAVADRAARAHPDRPARRRGLGWPASRTRCGRATLIDGRHRDDADAVLAVAYAAKSTADEHDSIATQLAAIRQRADTELQRVMVAGFAEANRSGAPVDYDQFVTSPMLVGFAALARMVLPNPLPTAQSGPRSPALAAGRKCLVCSMFCERPRQDSNLRPAD
jgi:hypothetical protein